MAPSGYRRVTGAFHPDACPTTKPRTTDGPAGSLKRQLCVSFAKMTPAEGVRVAESRFRIFRGMGGRFYYWLLSADREIILHSEGFVSKADCEAAIASVRENATVSERYERRNASDGEYSFVLIAEDGKPIGMSEVYTTKRVRDRGIVAVQVAAPEAPVEDMT